MPDPAKRPPSKSRLPPLNALRAFDAIARHLTVAKAADELNVTPSAVSHQLRTLEAALCVQLFCRNKTRLKLTQHGEALWPSVRSAFQMIAHAAAKLGDPAMVGHLVVSAPEGLSSRVLARHIGEFLSAYPEVRFRLIASNEDKDVYSCAVDLCIRYGSGIWSDRQVRLLTHVELFPVCSPALIDDHRSIRCIDELRHHPLLCEDGSTEWTRWLLGADVPLADFRMCAMGNAHIAMEAAVRGQGVALGNSLLVGDDLAEGRLVRLFERSVPAKHAYYLVCRHETSESPLVAAFTEWILARVRGHG
ncbi:transcriptional regulator GcvA [Verminephrobacter aporrectodeae subsp. tuberculatae]|uniref:Transcriptional regulator GcvA n=1 Tax=Verminephrobacter aporrectodeae subsp. tuberculatae TaxID=1110392 RepID=A0ABT3KRC9_9BURK|nr:transcriptional regulator GcvA [Verminephrobacter aporrectodeae subsp. tuberculatae]MCW5289450.1 transcriptional regulator GcvA [Verminephrobacter aporrectodeae subsp. tuberculatae]MCW5320889.1 transcriptional regulator GcvA [Verminephrobacter aporrectodeae subsp. tuberculatae]